MKFTAYFHLLTWEAKAAWAALFLAKVFGGFTIVALFTRIHLVKIFLPLWIIFLVSAIVLALLSRKHEPEIEKWWRYYSY